MLDLSTLSETARDVTSVHGQAESGVISAVLWLKLGVETVGAAIIALGILSAGWLLVKALTKRQTADLRLFGWRWRDIWRWLWNFN